MFYWLPHPSYASQITLILLRRGPPNCDTNTKHFSCSSFLLLPNFHTICKHMSSYSTIYCHNHNDQWPQSNEAHLPQSSHPPAVQFISSFNLYRVWLQFSNPQTKLSKSSISKSPNLKYFWHNVEIFHSNQANENVPKTSYKCFLSIFGAKCTLISV